MRWLMLIMVVAASANLGWSQGGPKTDLDNLQGAWKIVGGEKQGKQMTPEMIKKLDGQLTVKGDTMELNAEMKNETVTFKLDSTKKPKHIDLTTPNGKEKIPGIYEITGDQFKHCFDPEGKERPTDFKTKLGGSATLLVFKRVKK